MHVLHKECIILEVDNIAFNYFSIIILSFGLFLSGILIFKRATSERRIQLLLPAGAIFGISLYIFLINLTAHIVKGPPGFYLALFVQICITFIVVRRVPSLPMLLPKGKELAVWGFLLFFWIIFLYQITAHAITDGADSTLHQSFASRFIRGDYPMHQPWQPDYIAYYHFGGAELLGSFHALTGTPYYFLHPFIAFWMLLFASQILTWIISSPKGESFRSILIRSLPAVVGLISLGGFFIAWPVKFELDFAWKQFPTLINAFEVYGSPAELDSLVFFLHRFLAICLFISVLALLIYPKKKSFLPIFILAVYLATMALTDESVLIVTILPILIVSFFSIFSKSIKIFSIFISLISILIFFQGGLITESFLSRYENSSYILLFPKDHKSNYEKYLTYRLSQQDSKFFQINEQIKALNFFHPGIIWQLILYLILTIYLFKKSENHDMKTLSWLLLLSGIISLIAYFGLVPKGYTHPNGNRFLALSYYLSGLGLAFLCYFWFSQKINIPKIIRFVLKSLIIWILFLSLVPPFLKLFPRKTDNWFIIKPHPVNPLVKWVKDNIPPDKRILALTNTQPSNDLNIELVKEAGALTPVWPAKPRVHDSFDIGPNYTDLHYTLNPESVKSLKADYILITSLYFEQLPKKRQEDILNREFFTPIFTSGDNSIIILEVKPKFLAEGENFGGTFTELEQIAPLTGAYCIDYPPNITEHVYRILRFLLYNRKISCNNGGAFYNARIDIDLNFRNENERYDYLVLGKDTDPQTICHCQAKLLWTGFGNDVKFWQTQ